MRKRYDAVFKAKVAEETIKGREDDSDERHGLPRQKTPRNNKPVFSEYFLVDIIDVIRKIDNL